MNHQQLFQIEPGLARHFEVVKPPTGYRYERAPFPLLHFHSCHAESSELGSVGYYPERL